MNQLNNGSFKSTVVKTEPYEADEVDDIQSKLDKQLGPEYVSTRPGAGGVHVSYVEGWKAINLANQIFGFNGWYSEVKNINVDFLDDRNGKFSVGLSIVVRVTLKDGSYHEDIGYGSLDNARTKSMAFEKAKKEAMTDGLKRALRCFGNAMGNCLYDKEYLRKISGVKCAPPDFDETNLMRYTDAPSRPSTLPGTSVNMATSSSNLYTNVQPQPIPVQQKPQPQPQAQPQQRPTTRYPPPQALRQNNEQSPPPPQQPSTTIPEKRIAVMPQPPSSKRRDIEDNFDDSLTFSDDINLESEDFNDEVNALLDTKLKTQSTDESGEAPTTTTTTDSAQMGEQTNHQSNMDTPSRTEMNPPNEPVGFYKARVAEELQKQSPSVTSAHAFNTQFISPSIRRTLDPTKSTPIKRTEVQTSKANVRYDNPRLMPNRQIGKPRVYPPPKQLKDAASNKENGGVAEN